MPTGTDKPTEVSLAVKGKLDAAKVALGLADTYYGDQELLPRFPAACVESGPLTRELSGAGGKGQTTNTFTVYVIVYVGEILNQQNNRLEAEQLGEAIMDELHKDIKMNNTVYHGFVQVLEPGISLRGKKIIQAVRITWRGESKTLIV